MKNTFIIQSSKDHVTYDRINLYIYIYNLNIKKILIYHNNYNY